MAKRFTDTNKYKKPFIRSLPGPYKLLWDFLYHDCDHAGIWILDFQIAQAYIGEDMKIDRKTALDLFNTEDETRIVELDNGKKWFIPSFIDFQYGHLSEKNRAHCNVISILKKFDLLEDDLSIKKLFKPLTRPLQGAKEKEMEKEKEQEMEKEKEPEKEKGGLGEKSAQGASSEKLIVPEMFLIWKKRKPGYPEDRKKDFPALQSIAKFISEKNNLPYNPRDGDVFQKVLEGWALISKFVAADDFHKNWSLSQVEKHIQNIIQKIQNGSSKTGSGKQPTGGEVDTGHGVSTIVEHYRKSGNTG